MTLTFPPVAFSISSPNLRPPSAQVLVSVVEHAVQVVLQASQITVILHCIYRILCKQIYKIL